MTCRIEKRSGGCPDRGWGLLHGVVDIDANTNDEALDLLRLGNGALDGLCLRS